MATLRALDTPEPLERFVELTKMIRALETERDALKDTITEALQHEPSSDPSGAQYVDFDGMRVELCSRARWLYSANVEQMERDLRALKLKERATGDAQLTGHTFYPKVETRRARSEEEARERKANGIARYARQAGLETAALAEMKQDERDAVAKRAGQRSPSEKTWRLVLSKLRAQKIAA